MTDVLGRYYTRAFISNLLIKNIATKKPEKVLDLGIGDASLTKAARLKWGNALFYGTEIEPKQGKKLEECLSFIKVFKYDTLCPNVSSRLKIKLGSIDVAICNPPYKKIINKNKYSALFKSINCERFLDLKSITSEIVFFAHNIKLLKENGELGIIISDSLVTGKEFRLFRETILTEFTVKKIIQLPDNIFKKTEARAHILVLAKSKPLKPKCSLFLTSLNGRCRGEISIDKALLSERMDYHFWKYASTAKAVKTTFNAIGVKIIRGQLSYRDLKTKRYPFFHTTFFDKKDPTKLGFRKIPQKALPYTATKGDILMCRVGKRCVGKLKKVTNGSFVISDCIFCIRAPKEYRKAVWNSLNSRQGKDWIKAYAHGVCAQVISKCDLQYFPLFI